MSFKKGFAYVFISNVIVLIISVFTGFILPKMLSVDSYSNIKLFQLYISYIGILHLGFSDGMYLKYGGKKIDDINKKEIEEELHTFKIFQFIVMLIGLVISIIIKNRILFFCILSIIPINVGNYLRSLYQATGKFDKYAMITNINTFLMFVMNLILLFILKTDNSYYYIIFYVIAYFIYWILLEIEVSKIISRKYRNFKFSYMIENIKSGFLLMLGNFSSVLFTSIDRLFIKYFLGSIKFAYYSFAVSIEGLVNNLVNPVSIVMYNYVCKNNEKNKIMFAKRMVLFVFSLILLFVYPVKFIVEVWLDKYINSLDVLIILFVAHFFSIIVKCIFNNLYKANKKQNRYFGVMIIVIIISIISNLVGYFIFKSMEIFAIATMITSIIWFIIGEIDFKEYRYSIKEYCYIILIVLSFLATAFCVSTILGCVLYLLCYVIFAFLFLKDEVFYAKKELLKMINSVKKRFL